MKNNYTCLTYLLNVWRQGDRFTIFYDGNHCWSEKFDLGNCGRSDNFDAIETYHNKETVIKIFNLNKTDAKTLTEYFEFRELKNK
jgi:hypothetical protein